MRREYFEHTSFIDDLMYEFVNSDDPNKEEVLKRLKIDPASLDDIHDDTLYVCARNEIKNGFLEYKCPCGCGNVVIIPSEEVEFGDYPKWKIVTKDNLVTVSPSIYSVSWPCKSHYFITDNHVQWV